MPVDKPPILLKSRSDNHHITSVNGSVNSGINMIGGDGAAVPPVYSIQRQLPVGHRLAAGSESVRHHVTGEGTFYYCHISLMSPLQQLIILPISFKVNIDLIAV